MAIQTKIWPWERMQGKCWWNQQPRPFNKMWYSKFNGPGLQYEVAISIQGGYIVWINGPFFCRSWPDIKIFRERLIHALPQGEKPETDMGYNGEPTKIDLPDENIFDSNTQRKAKALVQSRHETCNRRFKQWNSLSLIFR